jgi:hypothetical protein
MEIVRRVPVQSGASFPWAARHEVENTKHQTAAHRSGEPMPAVESAAIEFQISLAALESSACFKTREIPDVPGATFGAWFLEIP